MLFHLSGQLHHHACRRLLRSASMLLLILSCPVLAFAQDAQGSDTGSSAPAAQPQPTSDVPRGGLLSEPQFIMKGLNFATSIFGDGGGDGRNGFYPEFSNMITGSGVISAGPGYRHTVLGGRAFIDTSAALSWHLYKMAQARFVFPELKDGHLAIGTQTMFQDNTQVSYFGIGGDALSAGQTQYRLQTTDVVGWVTARPARWLSFGAEVGWLHSPRVMATAGTFNPDFADARVVYAADPGMSTSDQPNFIHSQLSVTADTIDSRSHPTEGGLYRAAMTTYADRSGSAFSFTQYEAEALQMVPLVGTRVLLGLRGWTVFSDAADGNQVPFYLLPFIGGHNTLRSFHNFQFHDQNTVVANVEVRFALLTHVDLAPFLDAGSVAARYSDLNFGKTSVGLGLRLHTQRTTFGRLDVAHGSEGWNFVFRTNDPFKLSRVTRKLASVPFTP